jgi:hypothetical protein
MRSLARFLLVFSLVVWLGGIIFFSFVVAPALFAMVPQPETAGALVRLILVRLHLVGIACGVLFLAATFVTKVRNLKTLRLLVGLMVLLTALSQFGVMPQMERVRDAVGGPSKRFLLRTRDEPPSIACTSFPLCWRELRC